MRRLLLAVIAILALSACIQEPSLFIRLDGDGAGRVVSEPAGIDCGTTCGMIVDGSVTLTAIPRSDAAFAGWRGGGCESIEPCTPALTDTTTITATFTLARRTLTITKTGTATGTVTSFPLGITCGEDCEEIYSQGMAIELTATPDAGARFVGWLGEDECSATTPCNLVLDRDATISAAFEPL